MNLGRWNSVRKGQIEAWTVDLPGARFLLTTRRGGKARPPFHGFNLGIYTEDEKAQENLSSFLAAWAPEYPRQWHLRQVHSPDIVDVSALQAGKIGLMHAGNGDGLISHNPLDLLLTFHADCVPICVVDPEKRVIGLAHAGWRGTAGGVASNLVEHLAAQYDSDPGHLVAALGPAIGSCCYEVDEMVIEAMGSLPYLNRVAHKVEGRWALDLARAQREALVAAGLRPSHIVASRLCTSCWASDFFSYRREGPQTGRMLAAAGLVEGGS